jgi:hypothetical protein
MQKIRRFVNVMDSFWGGYATAMAFVVVILLVVKLVG